MQVSEPTYIPSPLALCEVVISTAARMITEKRRNFFAIETAS
jgi:hypothetical protein